MSLTEDQIEELNDTYDLGVTDGFESGWEEGYGEGYRRGQADALKKVLV